jgi:hypothetical protein
MDSIAATQLPTFEASAAAIRRPSFSGSIALPQDQVQNTVATQQIAGNTIASISISLGFTRNGRHKNCDSVRSRIDLGQHAQSESRFLYRRTDGYLATMCTRDFGRDVQA